MPMTLQKFKPTSATQNDVSNEQESSCMSEWAAILPIENQHGSASRTSFSAVAGDNCNSVVASAAQTHTTESEASRCI